MTRTELPIACAVNDRYVLPLAVMLTSLMEHLRLWYRPVLHLFHRGLSADSVAAISRLVETHSMVPDGAIESWIPAHPHFPLEATYPLLLPALLPGSLGRVLFLDADLLVLDDVAPLWESDLDGRALAAAPDCAIPLCSSPRAVKQRDSLGVPDDAVYFNAGVMLIDLDAWRQREVAARALDYLRANAEQADFLHQEALNAVLWNDWLPLAPRWNLLASVAGRRYGPRCDDWTNPGIVHFAGRFKPWHAPVGGPFDAPYREFLGRVRDRVPAARPRWTWQLLSLYDRYLRDYLYGCERALWNRRLL